MTVAGSDILFFLCLDDRGGAEISMIRVAQELLRRGYPVSIAAYGHHTNLARELGFTGEVMALAAPRSFRALMPLYKILRTGRFRVVISALTHTNIIALIAARMTSKKMSVFVTEHGLDGLDRCENYAPFKWLIGHIYSRAAAVIGVSQGLAQAWRDLLPSRAKVVAVYNPIFEESAAIPLPARPWLADKATRTIIGMGRLKTEKNFALLIRAFAPLAARYAIRLAILGEGDQRPVLENLARELGLGDKVLLPGFVTNPAAWLAHAALFVSPSQREGFGNAIVEALSYGVPVVATDCPYGPSEILAQGRYGRLVPVGDMAALSQAMLEALEENTDRQMLRMRAADFAVRRCIDHYAGLIDSLPR